MSTKQANQSYGADLAAAAFKYWNTLPVLFETWDLDTLRNTYQRQTGATHWFDAETLRFFGSRNLHVAAPGITVECQTNAPEGTPRYRVTAWVIDAEADFDTRKKGRITPQGVGSFWTLKAARVAAVAVSAELLARG
jgi:hypothetical protein